MPSVVRLATIDPGLDLVAIALWTIPVHARGPTGWLVADDVHRLGCLERVVRVETDPQDPLPHRLAWAGRATSMEFNSAPTVGHVWIERPGIAGSYARHDGVRGARKGKIAEGILGHHMALGVIVAEAYEWMRRNDVPTDRLRLLKPPAGKKLDRQERTRFALQAAGHVKRYGADSLDAIAVGLAEPWEFPEHAAVHATRRG